MKLIDPMKKLLGTVAFFCTCLCVFSLADRVLRPKHLSRRMTPFYAEEKNTMDVVFFGSSHMYFAANPVIFWEEAGLPSYVFASAGQPFWYSYHYLVDCLKVQKPKVVVIDAYMAAYDPDYYTQTDEATSYVTQAILPMKYSLNRAQAAMLAPEDMRINLMFGFPYYHDRANLQLEDLDWSGQGGKSKYKGFAYSLDAVPQPTPNVAAITEKEPISELSVEYLEKTVQLARKQGIEVILTVIPFGEIERHQPKMNTVEALAAELGVPFFNFNGMLEETGLDYETDFADGHHINYWGGAKVNRFLIDYIVENYQLEDRRGQPEYRDWDEWYEKAGPSLQAALDKQAQKQAEAPDEAEAEEAESAGVGAEDAPPEGPTLVEEIIE